MALPQPSLSTESTTDAPAVQERLKLLPKPGRPSLFSPERTAAICAIIEQEGISDSAAGALAGVTSSTLARWRVEQEGFALELERARALFELAQVRAIRDARRRNGSPDWRAAAWLLKHSSAEGYGPKSRMRGGKPPEQEREAKEQSKNGAILPETPREVGAEAWPAGDAGAGSPGKAETNAQQKCAILPETPASEASKPSPSGVRLTRLTRRDRRAEERRIKKEQRQAA